MSSCTCICRQYLTKSKNNHLTNKNTKQRNASAGVCVLRTFLKEGLVQIKSCSIVSVEKIIVNTADCYLRYSRLV